MPHENPITTFHQDGESLTVSGPLRPGEIIKVVRQLREEVQSRRELPPPFGEVVGGDISNQTAKREYTAEDREKIHNEMLKTINEHDASVLLGLSDVEGNCIRIENQGELNQ